MSEEKIVTQRVNKIIVTGGRYFKDEKLLKKVLRSFKIDVLVHGDCPSGADAMADKYALENNIEVKRYPALWRKHAYAAGPIRNREMLVDNYDGILVAFQGGTGTENCVRQARKLGFIVLIVDYEGKYEK